MPVAIQTREKIYKTAEAALYIGLSIDTFRKHVQRDNVHPFERVGLGYLFLESELTRFKKELRPRGNPAFSRAS